MAPRRPLLLHVFPTFAVGGAQIRFAAVANHFGAAWRHALVALDGELACRERLNPGLVVDFLRVPGRPHDPLGNTLRFHRALSMMQPDVLVTHNWGSIEWALANLAVGVRHVHIVDGFNPDEQGRVLRRRVWARRLLLRRSTVVLPSRTLLRIATDVWRIDPKRLRHIPNGIDLSRFAADPEPHDGPPVIGAVAALRAEKNLARLLRAFALLRQRREARLVIAGDGPERGRLTALAQSLGVAEWVQFAGHVAAPQQAYRRFDVFALSSDTEQMPLSVLEAMAAGLPVAATDVGDVATMLDKLNRPYVTPLDDAALAQAMEGLVADAGLRRALGAANRARATAEYDQQAMFRAYEELLVGPYEPADDEEE